jgi:hypothetical protein
LQTGKIMGTSASVESDVEDASSSSVDSDELANDNEPVVHQVVAQKKKGKKRGDNKQQNVDISNKLRLRLYRRTSPLALTDPKLQRKMEAGDSDDAATSQSDSNGPDPIALTLEIYEELEDQTERLWYIQGFAVSSQQTLFTTKAIKNMIKKRSFRHRLYLLKESTWAVRLETSLLCQGTKADPQLLITTEPTGQGLFLPLTDQLKQDLFNIGMATDARLQTYNGLTGKKCKKMSDFDKEDDLWRVGWGIEPPAHVGEDLPPPAHLDQDSDESDESLPETQVL